MAEIDREIAKLRRCIRARRWHAAYEAALRLAVIEAENAFRTQAP